MEKKKHDQSLREKVELFLRKVCGRVSPDRRAAVIIVMLVAFAALNIWVTARAIWSIGRGDTPAGRISLPGVTPPPPPAGTGDPVTDSLKLEYEKFFMENFNSEYHDTTTIEQDQKQR